jgi:imidazoleglycerol-phosphate dehydratase
VFAAGRRNRQGKRRGECLGGSTASQALHRQKDFDRTAGATGQSAQLESGRTIMAKRRASVERKTRETDLRVTVDLDGSGVYKGQFGVGFFEHMLELFARHALIDLTVEGKGDLSVDAHHTVEDIGICLGQAIRKALGDMGGVVRYGNGWVPMEEALAHCIIDVCNRPYLAYHVPLGRDRVGEYDTELSEEFWRALSVNAGITIHIRLLDGANTHHIHEAIFKSAGIAFGQAIGRDSRIRGVHSTKGKL